MKRFLLFFIIFSLIMLSSLFANKQTNFFEKFEGTYFVYCGGVQGAPSFAEITPNGSGYIVKTISQNRDSVLEYVSSFKGESLEIDRARYRLEDVFSFLDAKIVHSQDLNDESYSYYCYSELSFDSIILNNKKVNVQIAVCDNLIVVGFPIILGSY